jgi:hypothetical protein
METAHESPIIQASDNVIKREIAEADEVRAARHLLGG